MTRNKTPEHIDHFVRLLCDGPQNTDDLTCSIADYIAIAQDDAQRIQRWYNRFLQLRDRLLVLALHFFDGLPDDQFFAATEVLIDQTWLRRDESLRSLDYHDLERFIPTFFDYVQDNDGEAIKTHLHHQRRLVIWHHELPRPRSASLCDLISGAPR